MNERTELKQRYIEKHIDCTVWVAQCYKDLHEDFTINPDTLARYKKAIVEMVFNPQYDGTKCRPLRTLYDVPTVWGYDEETAKTILEYVMEDMDARSAAERANVPLYLRTRQAGEQRAEAYQKARGRETLGLRDIWYQFDWFDEDTIVDAINFAMTYDETDK